MNRASLVIGVCCLALGLLACGKTPKEPPARDAVATTAPTVRPEMPRPEVPPAPPAETWAVRTRALVADIQTATLACRDRYLIPFKFDMMAKRDVSSWMSIPEMDLQCKGPDAKTGRLTAEDRKIRGPWNDLKLLREGGLGKHEQLDRFLMLATDFVDHYRRFSQMCKKLGEPKDFDLVVKTAREARDRMILVGQELDEVARQIAQWPDDLVPDDDPDAPHKRAAVPPLAEFLASTAKAHEALFSKLVDHYDTYAFNATEFPKAPLVHSLRLAHDVAEARLARDRPELARAPGGDDKLRKRGADYFAAADALLKAYAAGYDRYENKVSGERGDTDPKRKPLLAAHKTYEKLRRSLLDAR